MPTLLALSAAILTAAGAPPDDSVLLPEAGQICTPLMVHEFASGARITSCGPAAAVGTYKFGVDAGTRALSHGDLEEGCIAIGGKVASDGFHFVAGDAELVCKLEGLPAVLK